MEQLTRIEIPLSRKKLIRLFVFGLAFLAMGTWMVVTDPQTSNSLFNNPVVKAFAGYGSLLLGIFGIYFSAKKLFSKLPGLVVDADGIHDHSSAFQFGLIPWSDITDIGEYTMQVGLASRQQFIIIAVKDPQKYIDHSSSLIKRKILETNARQYGSPIHISTQSLKTDHASLLQTLAGFFERYHASKTS